MIYWWEISDFLCHFLVSDGDLFEIGDLIPWTLPERVPWVPESKVFLYGRSEPSGAQEIS